MEADKKYFSSNRGLRRKVAGTVDIK
jgi:hypothetical protein